MPYALILLLLAFAAASGLFWARGVRINRALIVSTCATVERVFEPLDKTYTNIGGTIGYNFRYTLREPMRRLDGVVTTVPRHAILYTFVLRAAKLRDRLVLCLYLDRTPPGEAHIVAESVLEREDLGIDDIEQMQRTTVDHNGQQWLILSFNPIQLERMQRVLRSFAVTDGLRHFGFYGRGAYVSLLIDPAAPGLEALLQDVVACAGQLSAEFW